ncbi:Glyoxylase, beta-lactamase superfamily II [Virgibacillus subterraneus]|uniref:Glyoxylase, beta-lactamase superfamily II n=1 Tax=Virgibacillus subterraneus TaxID=621109 RepID=A0A1H9E7G4_9BACI|nr:MBL fold metallo-hydrolase [Virgibacillus subterraneus]SEQ21575.1 Glyoxylase, beta-lactamase superfamily II [Virgibacillus subterraneus]
MKVLDKTISQLTIPTPFAVGDTHVYLLKGETLSLVDAGVKTKEAWDALKMQFKELGYAPGDIEQIILTHHHPDHIGLIEQFPRAENIVAHKNVNPWLTRDEAFFSYYEEFFKDFFNKCGVPSKYSAVLNKLRAPLNYAGQGQVTKVIDEGDILPGHEDWQVIETKGHAQSHLSFFRDSDGAFIGGDHLLHHITPNPLLEPPQQVTQDRPRPMLQYRTNLNKCLSLGIKTVFPGHGDVFSDIDALLPVQMEKQEKRANNVYKLLVEKTQTPFELCKQIFPKQYEKQLDLTISETIGQLDYLEDQGVVGKMLKDGVYYYYAE